MRWRFLGLALAVVLLVVGCTSGATATPAAPANETPRAGGRVIEASFSDIRTLQPILVTDRTSRIVLTKIYDPLVTVDARTGEPKPQLAKWTISPDGRTYTFDIAANAAWSDGKPIVADDWLTTAKAIARSKKTTLKSNYQKIEGFAAYRDGTAPSISGVSADGKKLTVKFTEAFCPALVNTFTTPVLPTQVFGPYTIDGDVAKNLDDAPENTAPAVASGPFVFKEWRKGDQVVLARNSTYWKGAPHLDEYVFKIVTDTNAVVTGLKTGELSIGDIHPKDAEDFGGRPELTLHRFPALSLFYIGWNTRSATTPALADKRVRQALAYGLDAETIIKAVLFGEATPVTSYHPPAMWAAASGLNDYRFDRAKAESLLREAGYSKGGDGVYAKDGRPLSLSLVTNSGGQLRETVLKIATEQYKQLGIAVTPRVEAFATLSQKLSSGHPEIEGFIFELGLDVDPDPYAVWHSTEVPNPASGRRGFNGTGFAKPEVDRLLEQGRTGDCSIAARKRAYEQLNRILNDEQPFNFLWAPNRLVVAPAALRNFAPSTFAETANPETWWLKR